MKLLDGIILVSENMQMDNIGHIRTYEVTIVNLNTNDATEMVVQSGEYMSTGKFVIRSTLNGQEIVSEHDVYFTAFQQFRDKLLEAGYGIKCNGARLNAASFSKYENGPQVYILESGSSALPESSVDIWAKADIEDFPDSLTQNRYKNKWYDKHIGTKQDTGLSKLCLAGFILFFMPAVVLLLGLLTGGRGFLIEEVFPISLLICPLAGIIFSIAGLVSVRRHGQKGKGFGIAGVVLPAIALTIIVVLVGPVLIGSASESARMRKNEMYSMGSTGKASNTEYDVSQYLIPEGYDFKSLNITVSETEFKSYAESKLQAVSKSTEKSIRGTYQDYNFIIVRSDRLDEWLKANLPGGFTSSNGNLIAWYSVPWEFAATRPAYLSVYKDPSDKFIVITNCNDYKVISEFFD